MRYEPKRHSLHDRFVVWDNRIATPVVILGTEDNTVLPFTAARIAASLNRAYCTLFPETAECERKPGILLRVF